MKYFKGVITFIYIFGSLSSAYAAGPAASSGLRVVAYDERTVYPMVSFEQLDDYHKDVLLYVILDESGLPDTADVRDILATVMRDRATPETAIRRAVEALKKIVTGLNPEELTGIVAEAVREAVIAEDEKPAGVIDEAALKTAGMVLARMYAGIRPEFNHLAGEVDALLELRKENSVIKYIEAELLAINAKNPKRYSISKLSILRYNLARHLLGANRFALAVNLLRDNLPKGSEYHYVYKEKYYYLLSLAYEGLAARRPNEATLLNYRRAEEYLQAAYEYSGKEEARLQGLKPSLGGSREWKIAMRRLLYARRAMDSDRHLINCGAIKAICLLDPQVIDQGELLERGMRADNSELRDVESMDASLEARLNLIKAYLFLLRKGMQIQPSFLEFVSRAISDMRIRKLYVPRLSETIVFGELGQAAAVTDAITNPIHPLASI